MSESNFAGMRKTRNVFIAGDINTIYTVRREYRKRKYIDTDVYYDVVASDKSGNKKTIFTCRNRSAAENSAIELLGCLKSDRYPCKIPRYNY